MSQDSRPVRKVRGDSVVPIEEAMRIILSLQSAETLMAPLLIPVQGRQRLVIVRIILVDDHLIVSGDLRLRKVVTPLQRPRIRSISRATIRIGHGKYNGVVELMAVGKGGEVVRERRDARLAKRFNEDYAVVCCWVFLHKRPVRFQRFAEILRLEVPGQDAVLIVLLASGASIYDNTRKSHISQVCPRGHLFSLAVAKV